MVQVRASGTLVAVVALVGTLIGLPACTGAALTPITETHLIGTFDLAPVGTPGSENESVSLSVERPPGDLLIKRMRFFVADATGRELNLDDDGIHLHHVVMMSTKATDSSCPTSGYPAVGGQRFAASGNEKTPIVLPAGYAYHAGAGDSWRALWHLMNMGPAASRGVRLAYEITYVQGVPSNTLQDVTPWYLDVAGCTHADFDLPGGAPIGSLAAKSAVIPLPRAGRAVYTLGHLHDGGVDVSLSDPGGQIHCTATAQYGGGGHEHSMPTSGAPVNGHIVAMSVCPEPFDIGAGQSWTVTARYPGDTAFTDVMGVIFTYLAG